MTPQRFKAITRRYRDLRVVLIGDFSLDRYLEIDPTRAEKSIETGLPVYNVVRVRAQPGSAGTILNNLCALGVGTIIPIGFCGKDGEGYELQEALSAKPGVVLDHFLQTTDRCTFTYCKPLVIESGKPPRELNRLDQKNWSPTPKRVQKQLTDGLLDAAAGADAVIVMDQVDIAGTGVVTDSVLKTLKGLAHRRRELPIIADSRRGLRGYPPVIFKMNGAELAALTGSRRAPNPNQARQRAAELSRKNQRHVFVTLADKGIVGASPDGQTAHQPTWPVEGPIDIVGAGDSVTANLAAALAAGAGLEEAMAFANAAASIVIHQLGTTGTASVKQLSKRLGIGSR